MKRLYDSTRRAVSSAGAGVGEGWFHVSFQLLGQRQVARALSGLPLKIQRKITREALRPPANFIMQLARQKAPRRSGLMRRNIAVRKMKLRKGRTDGMQIRLGAGTAAERKEMEARAKAKGKDPKKLPYWGPFVEFGYRVGSRKLGESRRRIPGQHFLEKSFRERGPAARTMALQLLWKGVKKEARGK